MRRIPDADGTFGDLPGVLRLELVDPHGRAVLDEDRLRAAGAALVAHDRGETPHLRVVLITHEGPNFCVGGDVAAFAAAADPGAFVAELAAQFHLVIRALAACPLPVVAVVRGWAAGAGLSVVALADIVLASDQARFRPAYPGIGFSPDGGLTWTLPRAVGKARATDILLRNRILDAREAAAIGLVSDVVPDAELDAQAARLARDLTAGPRTAYGQIKSLIAAGLTADLNEHLDAEAAAIARSASGPEGREGVAAFTARRTARFADPEFRS